MPLGQRWQMLFIWSFWILLSCLLHYGPSGFMNRLDQSVSTGAGVSLKMIDQLIERGTHNFLEEPSGAPVPTGLDELSDEKLQQLTKQNQDLQMLIAELERENRLLKSVPEFPEEVTLSPLRTATPLVARTLGLRRNELTAELKLLIALGKQNGLSGNELVLEGEGVLLDQGTKSGLTSDQLVSYGRSLYGRTIAVGPSTTLVQPVSDPEFRTAVQLLRRSKFGTVIGARGILKGNGTDCDLIEVIGTEAVAVGDLVYTDRDVSPTAVPVYCGRVVEASIEPGAPHWTIRVEPVCSPETLPKELTVLRTELHLQTPLDQ